MIVYWFFVYVFTPENSRKAPIGAWICNDAGAVDYVFNSSFPEDEQIASDTVNRLVDSNTSPEPEDFLKYWQQHLGYLRTASEIKTQEITDYGKFFAKITEKVQ